MSNQKIQNIVEYLDEMKQDSTVPKNVKLKMEEVILILNNGESDLFIKKDRAIHIFEELDEDINIDSFTRTQLWNVISLIESL
jgi:uncharacterized protein